jgi:hypothetical protein
MGQHPPVLEAMVGAIHAQTAPCRKHGRRRVERAKFFLADPTITAADVTSRVGDDEISVFYPGLQAGNGAHP